MLPHPGCQSGAKPALRRLDTQKKPVVAFHPLQSEPKRFAFSLVIHFPGLIPARGNGWTIEPGVIAEANKGIHPLSQRMSWFFSGSRFSQQLRLTDAFSLLEPEVESKHQQTRAR